MSASPHNAWCDTCDHHADDCRCSVCSDCGKYFDPFHANSNEVCLGCLDKARGLEEMLEASVHALENGGQFVARSTLPSEATLNATHAQLARVCRAGGMR